MYTGLVVPPKGALALVFAVVVNCICRSPALPLYKFNLAVRCVGCGFSRFLLSYVQVARDQWQWWLMHCKPLDGRYLCYYVLTPVVKE